MSFSRVFVIAPMRSVCVQLQYLIELETFPETLLMRECGAQLNAAIAGLPQGGFGIVAGTGTGKTAGIREMCYRVLGARPNVGIVTMEHKGGAAILFKNVVIITPGVALQMIKSGEIKKTDLIVFDEVHQTSEQLELVMALLRLLGSTFVWMSATIDHTRYAEYLGARTVIKCELRDPARQATVHYHRGDSARQFLANNLKAIADEKRGVVVFVPTRNDARDLSEEFDGKHGVHVGFYHAGVPADELKKYMEGTVPRPYVICMTPAGSSSLNIQGLDTVVIVDRQIKEVIRNGKRQRVTVVLDNNMLLQMVGRVEGRAIGGVIHIITERPNFDLRAIKPETPDFKLGGDLELLALTTAQVGIDVRHMELIGGLDEKAYGRVFDRFVRRGLIRIDTNGKPQLTKLGAQVERMPVDPAWGEVIAKAKAVGNDDLMRVMCLSACTNGLYGLTSRDWSSSDDDLVVDGSDHLTAHNIVAEALRCHGGLAKGKYKLRGDEYATWSKDRGYSQKEIGNIVMLFMSLLTQLGMDAPAPDCFRPVKQDEVLHEVFVELLAMVQSMDYVRNETHGNAEVSGNGQKGVSYGRSVLGYIRRWNDKSGTTRANIEGTEIPENVVLRYAVREFIELITVGIGQYKARYRLKFADEPVGEITDKVDPGMPAAAAAVQRAEAARRMADLTPTARSLRNEVAGLLTGYPGAFGNDLLARLMAMDVSDDQLPSDPDELEAWIARAWKLLDDAGSALRPATNAPSGGNVLEVIGFVSAHPRPLRER